MYCKLARSGTLTPYHSSVILFYLSAGLLLAVNACVCAKRKEQTREYTTNKTSAHLRQEFHTILNRKQKTRTKIDGNRLNLNFISYESS